MKTKCVYICEICGEEYQKEQQALDCEALPTLHVFEKVGTLVKLKNTGDKGRIVGFRYFRSITQQCHMEEYEILLDNRSSTFRTLKQIEVLERPTASEQNQKE